MMTILTFQGQLSETGEVGGADAEGHDVGPGWGADPHSPRYSPTHSDAHACPPMSLSMSSQSPGAGQPFQFALRSPPPFNSILLAHIAAAGRGADLCLVFG